MRRFSALLLLLFALASASAETFAGPGLLITSVDPGGVAQADVNGDGNLDLIYVDGTFGPHSVHVLLGRGDGTFAYGYSTQLPSGICGSHCTVNIADVTGDGRLDLIFGGFARPAASVAVLAGNGDGTFQSAVVSTFDTPSSYPGLTNRMALGDLNGDGAADLVIADGVNTQIYVLSGDNTGTFHLIGKLFDGNYPSDEYLVDLNRDGRLDIVSMGDIGAGATVFLGNGDGTFAKGVRYSTGAPTSSMVLSDVTGDGYPDLVASIYPATVEVLQGKGDGTFAAPVAVFQIPLLEETQIAGTGDYNGDGIQDIALLNPAGVLVLTGHGNLHFSPADPSISGAANAATFAQGDFNKDGHIDLAMGVEGGIALLFGDGSGSFPGGDLYDLGKITGVAAVADFNADKLADIAVTVTAPTPRLLQGTGSGKFSLLADPSPGAPNQLASTTLVAGDFNGDGKPDLEGLLATDQGGITPAVLLGSGDGTFAAPRAEAKGSAITSDVNGDGRLDMLSIQGTAIAALLGQPDGSFTEVDTPLHNSQFPYILATGDISRDGKPDLVILDLNSLEVWLGNGDGTFALGPIQDASSSLAGAFRPYGSAALVDVDADGYLDLIVTPAGQGHSASLVIFYGGAGSVLQPPVFLSLSHPYSALAIADLNQDGRPDFVLNDGVGIATIHNLGSRKFGQETHFVAGVGFHGLTVADVNGDGFPDLVAPAANGTTVAVLLNHPEGTPPGGADTLETLTVSPEPSPYAKQFTATVSIGALSTPSPTPTGSVTFGLDGSTLGIVALSSGAATYTVTSTVEPGPHTLTAAYSGDTYFRPATQSLPHTVTPPTYATSTALTVSPLAALTSQTVRMAAVVTGTSPDQAPLGTVAFYDGKQSLGSQPVDPTGVAHFDTALLAAGTHTVTAVYQGFTLHQLSRWEILAPSSSVPVTLTISSVATSTTLSPSASSATTGSVVTLTAKVNSTSGVPFGGVTFLDGASVLGTLPLQQDGSAAFSVATLGIGTHPITASFTPNAVFDRSLSAAQNITIMAAAPNLDLTSVALNLGEAGTVHGTLVAQVIGLRGKVSGTVVFLDGGSRLGASSVDAQGQARLSIPTGQRAMHVYRASFSGNLTSTPSVSQVLTDSRLPSGPGFSISTSALSASVAAGQSARIGIQAITDPGFQQIIHLSCAGDVPAGYRCNILPAVLDRSGTAELTVTPDDSGATNGRGILTNRSGAGLAFGLAFVCFLRRKRSATLLLLGCFALLLQSGCGAGRVGTSPADPKQKILVVQASAGTGNAIITHGIQVAVVVQSSAK